MWWFPWLIKKKHEFQRSCYSFGKGNSYGVHFLDMGKGKALCLMKKSDWNEKSK